MITLPNVPPSEQLLVLRKTVSISLANIAYIEAGRSYCTFIYGQEVTTSRPMSCYKDRLPVYFFRAHKSYFVNLHYVVSYQDSTLCLTNGQCISVSRWRRWEMNQMVYDFFNR